MLNILLESVIFSATLVLIYMTLWFVIAMVIKRNDIADIAWGLGFITIALTLLFKYGFELDRSILVSTLVVVWGIRLAYHIFKRNVNKPEDKRYANWRNTWGKWFVVRSYFQIFILQGILMLLISTPIIVVNTIQSSGWSVFDLIGLLVWIFGFYFESVGDSQLKAFISNPANKGKVLSTGLWKYTRHPNYFGEVTQWWGIWIISLSVLPYGLLAIIGPLTISFLILKVSGIPMLEKSMSENPVFAEYMKNTSAFFPKFF
jgi:steroid 5-alpha reductase family enzyme